MILERSLAELCSELQSSYDAERFNCLNGIEAVVVHDLVEVVKPPYVPQCPVIHISPQVVNRAVIDMVVANEAELDIALDGIRQSPIASQVLTQLLRNNERVGIEQALFAESLSYSTLQHGAQFKEWLAQHERKDKPVQTQAAAILSQRNGDTLTLTLNRPEKRNAWSVEMRDALTEALQLLDLDCSITKVLLDANGPAFGAGGDLDEFGLARDAAEAHLTRSIRNPGALVYKHQDKIQARLHGACVGAGIEIPAFASRIVAKRGTFFLLPEVAFGLIPGAGGTASILRRIGRHRLSWMAIGGQRIDTPTALDWGLIDEIEA